eukprot:5988496-Prymnesium_polylepis.1
MTRGADDDEPAGLIARPGASARPARPARPARACKACKAATRIARLAPAASPKLSKRASPRGSN